MIRVLVGKIKRFYIKHATSFKVVGLVFVGLILINIITQLIYPSGRTLPGQRIGGYRRSYDDAAHIKTYLTNNQKDIHGKKIILTGSMIPISGFSTSDAGFNLGFVIGSFASVDKGIYLSMNGGIFTANEVEKNTDLLRFE